MSVEQPPQQQPPAGYPTYPPPGYPPAYYVRPLPTSGFAVASLVLGIIWVLWIGSALALLFGYLALSQVKAGTHGGRGLAITGIVLGWIGAATFLFLVVLPILGIAF